MLMNIYKVLLENYGKQGWWPIKGVYDTKNKTKNLTEEEVFEISVGAILTQNASWKNVEKSLVNLRNTGILNKNGIKKINQNELAELIKSSVYHNQKAKKLKIFVDFLESKKEINRKNLLGLWGIGPETADSISLYAYKKPIFVVDAYTKRIFSRIGIIKENVSYDETQKLFMDKLQESHELFNEFHALIVEHAKQKCKIKPECSACCLRDKCAYGRKKLQD